MKLGAIRGKIDNFGYTKGIATADPLPRGEGGRQVIIRSATPQIKRDNMQTFV
jgi:hypothetical protein